MPHSIRTNQSDVGTAQKLQRQLPADRQHDPRGVTRRTPPVSPLKLRAKFAENRRGKIITRKDSPLAECEALKRGEMRAGSDSRLTECGSATRGESFSSCPSSVRAPSDAISTLLIITANATKSTVRTDCCCSFKLDPLGGREHVSGLSSPSTNGRRPARREGIYTTTDQSGLSHKAGVGFCAWSLVV